MPVRSGPHFCQQLPSTFLPLVSPWLPHVPPWSHGTPRPISAFLGTYTRSVSPDLGCRIGRTETRNYTGPPARQRPLGRTQVAHDVEPGPAQIGSERGHLVPPTLPLSLHCEFSFCCRRMRSPFCISDVCTPIKHVKGEYKVGVFLTVLTVGPRSSLLLSYIFNPSFFFQSC